MDADGTTNPPATQEPATATLARLQSRSDALLALGQLADLVPLEQFLQTGIQLIAHSVEATMAALYLYDSRTATFRTLAVTDGYPLTNDYFDGDSARTDVEHLLLPKIDQREPLFINDRGHVPPSVLEQAPGIERTLVVPLVRGDEVIAIVAAANKLTPFVLEDAESLRVLADLILHVAQRAEARDGWLGASTQLEQTLWALVEALSKLAEIRDPYTAGHQRRVALLATEIGREMGLEGTALDGLRVAGLLHDLGKVAIPAEILVKPAMLSEHEVGLVRTHPKVGAAILAGVEFPWPITDAVIQHHERLDGSGYPDALRGDEIGLDARIVAVADVVEAMVSHRPYRPARPMDEALAEIRAGAGTLFDPSVTAACLRVVERHGGLLPGYGTGMHPWEEGT